MAALRYLLGGSLSLSKMLCCSERQLIACNSCPDVRLINAIVLALAPIPYLMIPYP